MVDRKKLVELIVNSDDDKNLRWYDLYDLTHKEGGGAEYFADYLIAHGVTVREWISVDERLPEEDTFVLVWCGEFSVFNYLSNGLWYTGYCDITTGEGGITHWMPLPEAPKGGADNEQREAER